MPKLAAAGGLDKLKRRQGCPRICVLPILKLREEVAYKVPSVESSRNASCALLLQPRTKLGRPLMRWIHVRARKILCKWYFGFRDRSQGGGAQSKTSLVRFDMQVPRAPKGQRR